MARQSLYLITGLNPAILEPSLLHFQGIAGRAGGMVQGATVGLHPGDVQYSPLLVDEGNRQGQGRVEHPHGHRLGLFPDEEHAVVRRQGLPEHESLGAQGRGVGHFGSQGMVTDVQGNDGQVGCRPVPVLGLGGQAGGDQQ